MSRRPRRTPRQREASWALFVVVLAVLWALFVLCMFVWAVTR